MRFPERGGNLSGSRVIFVRGDVTISANITLLGNGAFLAIVASREYHHVLRLSAALLLKQSRP